MSKLNLLLLFSIFVITSCVVGEVQAPKDESGATVGPAITSVSPTGGALAGGTSVTLTGSAFATGMTVDIGGVACSPVVVSSTTSATCTTGANTAGTKTVAVTRTDGESSSLTSGYTYQGAPTVTSISPTVGSTAGSTAVAITGTNFISGATVTIGGVTCTSPTVTSSTSMSCITGARAAATVSATITNPDTQSGSGGTYTYTAPPNPTSVDINAGPIAGGTAIVITGTNFASPSVTINNVACTVGGSTATTINCTTGDNTASGAGTYDIVVRNSPSLITGTLTNGYTYQGPPNATGISPSGGDPTTTTPVTITGTGFDTTNSVTVTVGGIACTPISNLTATSFDCTIQTGGTLGATTVSVQNNDGGSQSDSTPVAFTYQNPPSIGAVNAVNGTNVTAAGAIGGGTAIQITGSDFLTGVTATVGGNTCTISSSNSTTILCTTPAGSAGAANVVVTNPDGQTDTATGAFLYQAAPTVLGITPDAGIQTGGTTVTVTGTGFDTSNGFTAEIGSGNTCTVLGAPAPTATSFACTTPAGTLGNTETVIVENQDGSLQQGTFNGYTYQAPPTITAFSPSAGPIAGGGTMTINGTNFRTGMVVEIDGTDCPVTNTSGYPNSVQCTIPNRGSAASGLSVVVRNTDTQSATAAGTFTYQVAPSATNTTPTAGSLAGAYSIVVNGSNFVSPSQVTINGNNCPITASTGSTITCTAPGSTSAGAFNVVVTNNDGQQATITNGFTYQNPPVITNITPPGGDLAGTANLVISGSGFDVINGISSVQIGSVTCPVVGTPTASSITCDVPAQSAGTYSVTVTNNDGGTQSVSQSNAYRYAVAPTISTISPSGGTTAGGTVVTITGTDFQVGAEITLGGTPCDGSSGTAANFVNSTEINCTTRSGSAGARTVTVTNPDNQTDQVLTGYTYANPPLITSIQALAGNAPLGNGQLAGGSTVRILGSNFTAGARVFINGTECTSTDDSLVPGEVRCVGTPAGTGTVDVRILLTDTQEFTLSNGFTYLDGPSVTGVSPGFGPTAGGTTVTVTGTNFDTVRGIERIELAGVLCTTPTVVNSTTANCTSGATGAATAGGVRLVTNDGDLQEDTLAAAWSYVAPPSIGGVAPTTGPATGGTPITITGTDFIPGGTTVTIDGTACSITSNDGTTIVCNTGSKTITAPLVADVVVTSFDGQSDNFSSFTYTPPPVASTVSSGGSTPAASISGAAGSVITINGANIDAAITDVRVGGTLCTSVAYVSATAVNCQVPAGAGTSDITVTNPDGQSDTITGGFVYISTPTVSSVNPSVISTSATTPITITGSGFVNGPGLAVTIDPGGTAQSCTGLTFVNSSTLTCTAPTHAQAAVDVRVTNGDAGNQQGTGSGILNYYPSPTINGGGLSPANGIEAGGQTLTINGTNFISPPLPTVDIGGSACTGVTVVSPTQITCTTPAGTGSGAVTVTTFGTMTSNSQTFTYDPPPSISTVTPDLGSDFTPTQITISGSDFNLTPDANSVRIGGVSCTVVTHNASTITCDVGDGSAIELVASDVVVTNSDTQSDTASGAFTYIATPTISSTSPAGFADNATTTVTINGTNFATGATVTIGGAACTSPSVSPTQITCSSPTTLVGTASYNIVVLNPDGDSVTDAGAWEAQAVPNIIGISPTSGDISGGTSVTVTGTNLEAGGTISFAGFNGTVTSHTPNTQAIVTVPNGTGLGTPPFSVDVVYTNPTGQSDTLSGGFTYNPSAPEIVFQTGVTSNPEDYGTTGSNVSATFTLENTGSATTSSLTISLTGANPGAFFINSDTCTGTSLSAGGTCTVDIVFLGGILAGSTTYNATLQATDGSVTATNDLTGATP